MFFRKKSSSDPLAKGSIRKMDAVITTVILGGVIGSIYGIKKLKERGTHEHNPDQTEIFEVAPEKKKSFWQKIFGRKE